ncbi:Protein FAM83F [Merluccius polli]|uniref:Protein FAM83F n=1 Tax=Merluccius polli TaxID=89951 RepID=A0AA47NYQ9_MERPO|nr:Protein FAM83F [Merluccius polli]
MADSQLGCMEDGRIPLAVPESRPEFYYSEAQRAALEELLLHGDGAFKTRLKEDQAQDFLSAREIKSILGDFKKHHQDDDDRGRPAGGSQRPRGADAGSGGDSGVHSTYWPQMSDTDVPPLDIGWPGGGFFRGVTRVAVHTHPPKDDGPHIKEVVRRLIQEASKVVAIVMDLLTDLHILRDLMEAAAQRSVPVYILLDAHGVPHFLDMCCRLQLGAQHLQNIRSRTLQGAGLALSSGMLPGTLSNKYMLVDGDKVVFGSYSYAWRSARIDRNMITVMTGQVVEAFDRDFRELYAVSDKLDLYQELHVARPSVPAPTLRPKAPPKRPALPAATSRFQMSLGDAHHAALRVPAHKYHNPKYLLALGALGDAHRPARSLHDFLATSEAAQNMEADPGRPRSPSSERLDRLHPLPSEEPPEDPPEDQAPRRTLRQRLFKSSKKSVKSEAGRRSPSPTATTTAGRDGDGGAGGRGRGQGQGQAVVEMEEQEALQERVHADHQRHRARQSE